jgi:hypothetical protein
MKFILKIKYESKKVVKIAKEKGFNSKSCETISVPMQDDLRKMVKGKT